jgi:hypothetical protein
MQEKPTWRSNAENEDDEPNTGSDSRRAERSEPHAAPKEKVRHSIPARAPLEGLIWGQRDAWKRDFKIERIEDEDDEKKKRRTPNSRLLLRQAKLR